MWILRRVVVGLEYSLHPEIAIPTPSNIQVNGEVARPTVQTQVVDNHGGLASSFALLEIAHTHFFPLPNRLDRRSRLSAVSTQATTPQSPRSPGSLSSLGTESFTFSNSVSIYLPGT